MKMSDVFGSTMTDNPVPRLSNALVLFGPEKEAATQAIVFHDELCSTLEMHIKILEDLYPSDVNDIDEAGVTEFEAVHKLISKTKMLLIEASVKQNKPTSF